MINAFFVFPDQIDAYADNSGYIDVMEFNAFFDYYGGEHSPQAIEALELLETEAQKFSNMNLQQQQKQQQVQQQVQPSTKTGPPTRQRQTSKNGSMESSWEKRVRKQFEWLNKKVGSHHGRRISYRQCKQFFDDGISQIPNSDTLKYVNPNNSLNTYHHWI